MVVFDHRRCVQVGVWVEHWTTWIQQPYVGCRHLLVGTSCCLQYVNNPMHPWILLLIVIFIIITRNSSCNTWVLYLTTASLVQLHMIVALVLDAFCFLFFLVLVKNNKPKQKTNQLQRNIHWSEAGCGLIQNPCSYTTTTINDKNQKVIIWSSWFGRFRSASSCKNINN